MKNVNETIESEIKFIPKKVRKCRYCRKPIDGPNYFFHSECLNELEASNVQDEFITY